MPVHHEKNRETYRRRPFRNFAGNRMTRAVCGSRKGIRRYSQTVAALVFGLALSCSQSLAGPNDFTARFMQLQHTDGKTPFTVTDQRAVSRALRDLSQFGLWQFGSFRDPLLVAEFTEAASILDPFLEVGYADTAQIVDVLLEADYTDTASILDALLDPLLEAKSTDPWAILQLSKDGRSIDTAPILDIQASFGDTRVVAPSITTLKDWLSYEDNFLDSPISIEFGEQTHRIYYQIARRFALLDSERKTTELVRLIADNEQPWESAKVLAVLKDTRAIVPLAPLLHHPVKRVRWSAAYVLAHHEDVRCVTPLLELLRTPLKDLDKEGFSPSTGSKWVKQLVILPLSEISDPRILDTLLHLTTREGIGYEDEYYQGITESSNSIFGVAMDRLSAIVSQVEDAESIEKVVLFLSEERDTGRQSIFDPGGPATHFFRNPRARPHLERLAAHSEPRVREVATEALNELNASLETDAGATGDNPLDLLRNSALGKPVSSKLRRNVVQFSESAATHTGSASSVRSTNCVSDDVYLRFPEAVDYIASDPFTRETLLRYRPEVQDAILNVMRYRDVQAGWMDKENFGEALVSVAIAMLRHSDPAVRASAVGILASVRVTEYAYDLQYYSYVPIIKYQDVERAHAALESVRNGADARVRSVAARAFAAIEQREIGEVLPWKHSDGLDIYQQYPWEWGYADQIFDFLFGDGRDGVDSDDQAMGNDPRQWPSRMANMLMDAGVHLPRSRFNVLPGEYLMPSNLSADLPLDYIAGSYHTGNSTGAAIDRQIIPVYLELGDRAFEYMLGEDYIFNEDWFIRDGIDQLTSVANTRSSVPDVPRSRSELVDLLTGDDVRACQHAARQLARLRDERALEPLISMLEDNNNKVRAAAARSLATVGDTRAVDALSELLADKDPDVRRWAAVAIGMLGGDDAVEHLVRSIVSHHDDRHVSGAHPALDGMVRWQGFGQDSVQGALVGRIAESPDTAAALLPAVTEVESYHDGLLFCVDAVARNSTYVDRLAMLQAMWRWRGHDGYGGIAGTVLEEVERIQWLYGEAGEPHAYTWLAAAVLAVNDGDFERAREWSEKAAASIARWDVVGQAALSVVLAEALVSRGRGLEALRVVDAATLNMGSRQMPYRLRDEKDRLRLEFLPLGELLMTKAYVLSNLEWHDEAIAVSEEAERVLRANLLWKWIDGDQFIRQVGTRIAPVSETSHRVLQKAYGEIGRGYFGVRGPRGVQETYGYSLLVAEAIDTALSDGTYPSREKAFEIVDEEALQLFSSADKVEFDDEARNKDYRSEMDPENWTVW